MSFWTNAHETVPSNGDSEPRLCLVILSSGAVSLGRFITPKYDAPYWDIDSALEVDYWAFIPDAPEES